ncbi:hypothetical protein ACFLZB_02175 [Nanoarchaeota archaeon]
MIKKDTSIRIKRDTKRRLENLDFVKKQSYNEIIVELIKKYRKSK